MAKTRENVTYGRFGSYPGMLRIAERACKRCIDNDDCSDAVIAIVFAVVALEAFINELGGFAQSYEMEEGRVRCFGQLMEDLEDNNERLQDKYHRGYFALTGQKCPRGKRPFQDFAMLVSVRNQIVHYESQRYAYDLDRLRVFYDPPKIVRFLAERKLIPKPSPHGDMAFMSRIGTSKVAVWSFNTAVRMIGAMNDAIPASRLREMQLLIRHPGEIDVKSLGKKAAQAESPLVVKAQSKKKKARKKAAKKKRQSKKKATKKKPKKRR